MKNKYLIAIDLGGTNLRVAVFSSRFALRDKKVFSTAEFDSCASLIAGIAGAVNDVLCSGHISRRDISAVGVGLPGPIDTDKGIVHFFPNIPGWSHVPFRALLQKKLGIPVYIDNDANLMALAEFTLGAARGSRNAVCLTLGTGVGGGLIIEGKLFRGSSYAAGEIGHMPINEHGPLCNCSGSGCLEAYIGNRRILQQARSLFKRPVTLEEVSALARKNDRKAVALWQEVGGHLGVALAQVVNLINPDRIVIGGGVANAGEILFDAVRKTLLERAMLVHVRAVSIHKASLGNDAGLIGAAILAAQAAAKKL